MCLTVAQPWAKLGPMNPTTLSVSVREAAAITSLSEYEIRKAVNAGELEAVRRGVRIVIPVSNLDAWIKALPKVVDDAEAS